MARYNLKEKGIKTPIAALRAAQRLRKKRRVPELEALILENPKCCFVYANSFLMSRWPEAEKVILQNASAATDYAISVLKKRWEEAESNIMQEPFFALKYATSVLGARWKEAEGFIAKDPKIALKYMERFLPKERWEEAEEEFKKEPLYLMQYAAIINRKLPEELHNRMIVFGMSDLEPYSYDAKCVVEEYFTYVKKLEVVFRNMLEMFDDSMTVANIKELINKN